MVKVVRAYRLPSRNVATNMYILHTNSGHAVYSSEGKRLSRYYPDQQQAANRLVEIVNANKNHSHLIANASIVPTSLEKDPTRESGNRRRAKAELTRRLNEAQKQIMPLIEAIPVERIEVKKVKFVYSMDEARLENLFNEIAAIINLWLQTQRQTGRPARWFFGQYIEEAYGKGTLESSTRIKGLYESVTGELMTALDYQRIITSEPYKRRLDLIYARTFEGMVGFSGEASSSLARILTTGMIEGLNPREMARNIRKEFKDIKGYRAMRVVRTEINNAHTQAKAEQQIDARDRLGIDVRTMHVSALVPNTRASHAQRHGKLYTPEQQQAWWSEGSNRINCLCSTLEIVFLDGKMMQKDLVDKVRERGDIYFEQNPKKARSTQRTG